MSQISCLDIVAPSNQRTCLKVTLYEIGNSRRRSKSLRCFGVCPLKIDTRVWPETVAVGLPPVVQHAIRLMEPANCLSDAASLRGISSGDGQFDGRFRRH